jgi:hypothetical protein
MRVSEIFEYAPEIPQKLRWKVASRCKGDLTGKPAGSMSTKGYWVVKYGGKTHKTHRLVYAMHNKDFDLLDYSRHIDHLDGIRSNSAIENLREASRELNGRNISLSIRNNTGVTGVNLKIRRGIPVSYRATWSLLNMSPKEKSFSLVKYGEELAFFMACEYRDQMINLLNLQGAGYTGSHGKFRPITEVYGG